MVGAVRKCGCDGSLEARMQKRFGNLNWKNKEVDGGRLDEKEGEFYQTFSALVMRQAWQPQAVHHEAPYQEQSPPASHIFLWR